MYFIGVDYHKVYSQIAVMDEQGAVVREGQVINDVSALRRFLGEEVRRSRALLETTRNWEVMYDWLTESGAEVKLGHAGKLKVIGEARIKTDKIDARMLAHLLRCNLVPEAPRTESADTRSIEGIVPAVASGTDAHAGEERDSFFAGSASGNETALALQESL